MNLFLHNFKLFLQTALYTAKKKKEKKKYFLKYFLDLNFEYVLAKEMQF